MIGGDDALTELLKIRAREHAAKLRLPYQEGLEGRDVFDLKIRQHAKLFKGAHRQILSFIDDQKGAAAMFIRGFEESLQPEKKGAFVARKLLQSESRRDHAQQAGAGEPGGDDVCGHDSPTVAGGAKALG